jgi:SAM-dependent methyltransferase
LSRSPLEAHYALERSLADRLRAASREERRGLYREIYDRLERESPLYAERRSKPTDRSNKERATRKLVAFLEPFLSKDAALLEIGAGDGLLSRAIAPRVREVIAIDVSRAAFDESSLPNNVRFVLTDGFEVPIAERSIDLAFSNQVMEHLHPDDAIDQLASIQRALRPGGAYVCITPSRFTGPHDVSKHFDREATGLHLKEWTVGELADVFARSGFVEIRAHAGTKGRFVSLPVAPIRVIERMLALIPLPLRRAIARLWPIRAIVGVRLSGKKR